MCADALRAAPTGPARMRTRWSRRSRRPPDDARSGPATTPDGLTVAIGHAHFLIAICALGCPRLWVAQPGRLGLAGSEEPRPGRQVIARGLAVCARSRSDSTASSRIKRGDMANGTVKWFNSAKGYGFIQ